MSLVRTLVAVLAVLALPVAAAGCGLGAGDSAEGEAELRVTRDYGTELMLEANAEDPAESDTAMRLLDREAEITTRYGGGFVQSIDGISGGAEGGRTVDWFIYVNGIESSVGAAELPVRPGDRFWWDHRDWTDAMRVPAVVGSYPEPLAQAATGAARVPVRLECAGAQGVCDEAAERLAADGVDLDVEPFPVRGEEADAAEAMRVLVGEWEALRADPAATVIEKGPSSSGVFATFERAGDGWRLMALDARSEEAAGPASLLAAVAPGGDLPTWVVTGEDPDSVADAVDLLAQEALRDRYAVAASGDSLVPLPVGSEG